MTILINLLGQPSTGKSTTMADLFCALKYDGKTVEMCPEWIKKWAWENKKPSPYDQFYIMGKEIRQQSMLFNKVDYIISDSPVFLTAFYQQYYTHQNFLAQPAKDFYNMANGDNVKVYNFFLEKNKKYNPKGRFQTEQEAKTIGDNLKQWLIFNDIEFNILDCCDKDRVSIIIGCIKKAPKG